MKHKRRQWCPSRMNENGVLPMKDFARLIGVSRHTVADVVAINNLPIERMTHGQAKGLSPSTQRRICKILGVEARPAAASN